MAIVMQNSFLQDHPVVSGNLRDRMRYILIEYPAARDDYMVALFRFWQEFEGLDQVLGDKVQAFREWFTSQATSPKTLQNRCMEVQARHPELEASPQVEERRQRMAKQGPVL